MFVMSLATRAEDDEFVGDLAAVADDQTRPAMLQRLPLSFESGRRFAVERRLSYGDASDCAGDVLSGRKDRLRRGLLAMRCMRLLEMLTKRLADGASVDALLRRGCGMGAADCGSAARRWFAAGCCRRLVARVKTALGNMLKDAEGLVGAFAA